MNQGYPKAEKLKSRAAIDNLFNEGKSLARYPLRLVYHKSDEQQNKFGVSVSKKYFKKAADRNYIKRVLRECYRKNKMVLESESSYNMMLLYQSKDKPDFFEIEQKTVHLLKKLSELQNAGSV